MTKFRDTRTGKQKAEDRNKSLINTVSPVEYDKANGTECSELMPMRYKYLSADQRKVVELIYSGHTIAQIADIMEISTRSVTRIKRETKAAIDKDMQRFAQ